MTMTMKKPSKQELSFARFSNGCRNKAVGFSPKRKELLDICRALPGTETRCQERCPRINEK